MGEMPVDPKGVTKLLDGPNVHKASGPEVLNARLLKALIYYGYLALDNVPDTWQHANVVPAFYKRRKSADRCH